MKIRPSALTFFHARSYRMLPQFFTATILEWKPLLREERYKEIILSSLRFLVDNHRIVVYAFVIMPNHIHPIWHIGEGH